MRGRMDQDRAASLLAEAAAVVASEQAADLLDEAAEILVAEQGRLAWMDRFATGSVAQVSLWAGLVVIGRAEVVGPDAFTFRLVQSPQYPWAQWAIIPATAVLCAEGLPTPLPQDARPALTWSFGQMLRQHLGWAVQVHLRDGSCAAGQLHHVGADHLDLITRHQEGSIMIPFEAAAAVFV